MKILFTLTIIFFQSFPSLGEWSEIDRNTDNDVFYIDLKKIKKIDGHIYYWTLIDFSKMDQEGDLSEKNLRKVDCKKSRYSLLRRVFYKQSMGRGQISNDYVKGLNKWTYVIPDTVNENVLNIVCKR